MAITYGKNRPPSGGVVRGLSLVNHVLLAASAAAILLSHLMPDWQIWGWFRAPENLPYLLGIAFFVLMSIAVMGALSIAARTRRGHIYFLNEAGGVSISADAIEESLARTLALLPEVSGADVTFHHHKLATPPVRITVDCAAWEGGDVPAVCEKIQQALKMRFSEIVRLAKEESPRYDIFVSRIVARETKRPEHTRPTGSREQNAASSYLGPQYPIDADVQG